MMTESMTDLPGQQLGNYRLLRLLGRGGFADVYLGEHIYLKTQAAIKVLHTRVTEADIEEVLNEARTIATLEHPNIVRLYECGVEKGYPFLVMSYAPNGSLRQRCPKGSALPAQLVLSYVQQVASALQYAHNHKLIHRDVKPENMLIGQDEQVLLSDFGLVMMAQTSRSQATGDMAGTVAYMAPEQLQGKPRFASDQYALGVVTYEWLCGKRPFTGVFAEVASQHVLTPPPSLRALVPELPEAVEQVVFKALAKDPAQRFENIEQFAQALTRAYPSDFATVLSASMGARQAIERRVMGAGGKFLQLPSREAGGKQASLSGLEAYAGVSAETLPEGSSAYNTSPMITESGPSTPIPPNVMVQLSASTTNLLTSSPETITPPTAPLTPSPETITPPTAPLAVSLPASENSSPPVRRSKAPVKMAAIVLVLLILIGGSASLAYATLFPSPASIQHAGSAGAPTSPDSDKSGTVGASGAGKAGTAGAQTPGVKTNATVVSSRATTLAGTAPARKGTVGATPAAGGSTGTFPTATRVTSQPTAAPPASGSTPVPTAVPTTPSNPTPTPTPVPQPTPTSGGHIVCPMTGSCSGPISAGSPVPATN